MKKYPRQCGVCERFYKSQSAFSTHKRKCHEYAAQIEVASKQKEAAVERIITTLPDSSLSTHTTIVRGMTRDPREERISQLENQLNILVKENELLKVEHEITNRKISIRYAAGESIYLAQTRDCFDKDNNVFKFGRTTRYEQRKRGYPKGTIFFTQRLCLDAQMM